MTAKNSIISLFTELSLFLVYNSSTVSFCYSFFYNSIKIDANISQYGESKHKSSFILEVIVSYHETRMSQMDEINAMPLYPTEEASYLQI